MEASTSSAYTLTPRGREVHTHMLPTGKTGDVKDVGCVADGGSSRFLARADHVHRGVLSLNPSGAGPLYCDIKLDAGSNISITNVGNTITIASSAPTPSLPIFGFAAGQDDTFISADADVAFDVGATPYPNQGFVAVPAPGGTTFVVGIIGSYEFDFYVAGTHPTSATTSLQFAIYINGVVASVGGIPYEYRSDFGSGTSPAVSVCKGSGLILLNPGDMVTLHNRTNNGSDVVTVTSSPPGGEPGLNRTFTLKKVD